MSAPFKVGDRAVVEFEVTGEDDRAFVIKNAAGAYTSMGKSFLNNAPVTPPPAPKAEREAKREPIPSDARVGDVYKVDDMGAWAECEVGEVQTDGKYAFKYPNGGGLSHWFMPGYHAASDRWFLLKRGPEPKRELAPGQTAFFEGRKYTVHSRNDYGSWYVRDADGKQLVLAEHQLTPAPTPEPAHEWKVGDVGLFENGREYELAEALPDGRWRTKVNAEGSVWFVNVGGAKFVRHNETGPEPAKGMTAGERFRYEAIKCAFGSPPAAPWSELDNERRAQWDASAALVLAAQPAPAAKGEREVVGYLVKDDKATDNEVYFGKRWAQTRGDAKPTERVDCYAFISRRAQTGWRIDGMRVIKVTRRRKPAT